MMILNMLFIGLKNLNYNIFIYKMLATGGPTELKNEMNITDDTFDKYYIFLV